MQPSQNTEELYPESQKKILLLVQNLIDRYSHEALSTHIATHTEKIERITHANQKLAGLGQDEQDTAFKQTVQEILDATQDYYAYITTVPEDLRRFFLIISDSNNAKNGTIDEINELLDLNIRLSSPPLPSSQAIRPKNYIMQIDAITNQLATLNGHTQLNVGKRGSQPITTTVTLDMPDHMKIEGGHAVRHVKLMIVDICL